MAHRLDFEERSGKFLRRADVEAANFNLARTFRDRMQNIPERVAAMIAAESDPHRVHEILTTEIRKALFEFADSAKAEEI